MDDNANFLQGNHGVDKLYGWGGNDPLSGGGERDTLSGGAGADTFLFTDVRDIYRFLPDTVLDFEAGVDIIDLGGVDATHVLTEIKPSRW